jgi:vacuolar-type H+-ATPase subunit H
MASHRDARPHGSTAEPIERVLRTERDAESTLAQARQAATAELERARDDALTIVNRALERSSRWQQAHAAALASRLERLRQQDDMAAGATRMPDAPALRAVVDRVAARLTGAPYGDPGDATA